MKKRKYFPQMGVSGMILVLFVVMTFLARWQNRGAETYVDALQDVPAFSGKAYVVLNDGVPVFMQEDLVTQTYELYGPLDALGRCTSAMACLGKDLMPTAPRESISHIKPSGWMQAEYEFVDGKNLYNRCHLIGFQLAGENDNEKNLITGTRFMNVEGMLPFENMIADYIKGTGNHVLYRVTPIYEGSNLVASGVQLEAMSVEDTGGDICINVYIYNNQPGVEIDYATGNSWEADPEQSTKSSAA